MEHAKKQQEPKESITSSDTIALTEFDQKITLFETMTKSKSFNKSPKQRALYHALMESILKDEDVMDERVADKLKKRKYDVEPSRRPSRLKLPKARPNLSQKSTVKSAQAEETVFEAGDTQEPHNQGQDMGNTDDQPNVKVALKHDWFKKPERPLTPYSDWNVRKSINFRPPQTWISKIAQAKKPPLSFDELMSTPIDFSAYNNPEGKEYPFDLSKPLPLIMVQGRQVIPVDYFINNDLEYLRGGSSSKKYTTSTTKIKAAKYDISGIEDMFLLLWSPVKVSKYDVYSTKRIIAVTKVKVMKWYDYGYLEVIEVRREDQQLYKFKEDKYNRNRLMRLDELYKFSDGTLTFVRTVLHDTALNLRMDYLPKRRWSNLDK
ncbi:hypothetical protein Tco_0908521 [Tanacetum coccineum]|uniref:Uncharacterized protein n=1 Tax=Tanacetum coccineum TaxID=301880 RepID=A0ABQ5CQV4_9ASTR